MITTRSSQQSVEADPVVTNSDPIEQETQWSPGASFSHLRLEKEEEAKNNEEVERKEREDP